MLYSAVLWALAIVTLVGTTWSKTSDYYQLWTIPVFISILWSIYIYLFNIPYRLSVLLGVLVSAGLFVTLHDVSSILSHTTCSVLSGYVLLPLSFSWPPKIFGARDIRAIR